MRFAFGLPMKCTVQVLFTIAAVGKFNVVTVTVPSGALKAYSGLAVPQFSWSFATEGMSSPPGTSA